MGRLPTGTGPGGRIHEIIRTRSSFLTPPPGGRIAAVNLEEKEQHLFQYLERYRRVIVAFSGGVDSSYLAFCSHRVLGRESRAVTALSPSVSAYQRRLALDFARRYRLNHTLVETREMDNPDYVRNPTNRCYFCKDELYVHLKRLIRKWDAEAILDGSNMDDIGDYRPGRRASREQGVLSPFIDVKLSKDEIRSLSLKRGLPTWDLPAMPCLSSRFPYGVAITEEKLQQVDAAEAYIRSLGVVSFRVRHHEELARIEVDRAERHKLMDPDLFDGINRKLRSLGYRYVTLDLQSFRSGSLNQVVNLELSSGQV